MNKTTVLLILIVAAVVLSTLHLTQPRLLNLDEQKAEPPLGSVYRKAQTLLRLGEGSNARKGYTLVCFEDYCFKAEIAKTEQERRQGLMGREELPANAAMLFVFPKEKQASFWMKNTLIPLDIIWLNKNKEIVFIKKNAKPCKTSQCPNITPNKKARYVLETRAGTADKIGLRLGDKLTFNNP